MRRWEHRPAATPPATDPRFGNYQDNDASASYQM